jgi:hypothetical protein
LFIILYLLVLFNSVLDAVSVNVCDQLVFSPVLIQTTVQANPHEAINRIWHVTHKPFNNFFLKFSTECE